MRRICEINGNDVFKVQETPKLQLSWLRGGDELKTAGPDAGVGGVTAAKGYERNETMEGCILEELDALLFTTSSQGLFTIKTLHSLDEVR